MNTIINRRIVTPESKRRGTRLPLGTEVLEYRNRYVYLYPSGKRFVKFKTAKEIDTYINSWPLHLDETE